MGCKTKGHGRFAITHTKLTQAHRFSYELYNGEITGNLTIDHLCRNRNCVNPQHLEVVTIKENVLRGIGPTAINSIKTHCIKGHEFNEKNTYIRPNGDRNCRECNRINARKYI